MGTGGQDFSSPIRKMRLTSGARSLSASRTGRLFLRPDGPGLYELYIPFVRVRVTVHRSTTCVSL